jgi:4'-phosphopantetheinyl transferase
VHVWLVDLDRPPLPAGELEGHLAPDERERAARFRFDVHRRRFATGRGLLRELLGRLLGEAPASLSFVYGEKGKPSLPGTDLRFNLSHSQNAALVAVCRGRELGVDVEHMRWIDDAGMLVERFFAPWEREIFAALDEGDRLTGFYTGWTRKEAYVKARGDGLSLPTSAFEVEMAPGSRARLLRFDQEPEEVGRWTLAALEPADGFLGALAVEAAEEGRPEVVARLWSP